MGKRIATASVNKSSLWPLMLAFVCGSLSAACAPTLAGQLHGDGAEFNSEARVNVTPLLKTAEGRAEEGASLSSSPTSSQVLILPVDASGRFTTREALAPGVYLVEALVPGYSPQSQRLDLRQAKHLELNLKALAKTPQRGLHTGRGAGDSGRGAGGATLTPPSL